LTIVETKAIERGPPTRNHRRSGRKLTIDDEVKAVRESESRSERTALLVSALDQEMDDLLMVMQGLCREIFKKAFDVNGDDDWIAKESVDPSVVRSFETCGYPKPDEDNLLFDFRHGHDSMWNDAVVNILVRKLQESCRPPIFPPKPESYLADLVQDRYRRVRAAWRHGLPRTTDEGILETPDALEDRLVRGKDHQLKTARRRERRTAVSELF
jgi:hypothetical protein